jgi:hypothetical protein
MIDKREDDVRFYPIPEPAQLFVLGRKALPEGLRLIEGAAQLPLAQAAGEAATEDAMV